MTPKTPEALSSTPEWTVIAGGFLPVASSTLPNGSALSRPGGFIGINDRGRAGFTIGTGCTRGMVRFSVDALGAPPISCLEDDLSAGSWDIGAEFSAAPYRPCQIQPENPFEKPVKVTPKRGQTYRIRVFARGRTPSTNTDISCETDEKYHIVSWPQPYSAEFFTCGQDVITRDHGGDFGQDSAAAQSRLENEAADSATSAVDAETTPDDERIAAALAAPPGPGARILFAGVVDTNYGLFDITWGDEPRSDDLASTFRGQHNGLVGAADPRAIHFVLARRSGGSAIRIELLPSAPPPPAAEWEDVVEVSATVPADNHPRWLTWSDMDYGDLGALPAGPYRIRTSALGRDQAVDDEFAERCLDCYLIQLWPAPLEPDRIVRIGSENAASYHGQWQESS